MKRQRPARKGGVSFVSFVSLSHLHAQDWQDNFYRAAESDIHQTHQTHEPHPPPRPYQQRRSTNQRRGGQEALQGISPPSLFRRRRTIHI